MLIVNIIGLALIGLIAWWFWLYKPAQLSATSDNITIVVDAGSYSPTNIKVKADQPVTLNFDRKDASPCAEVVIFPQLEISRHLSLQQQTTVDLPALAKGEYDFHCQMQMYRGTLEAE